MSMFAQLPGQEILVPVNFAAGKTYYFQCDPHALLGMVGTLKVEDE
jgi:plastocyanin